MNTNTLRPEYAKIAEVFLLAWDEGQYERIPTETFILELVEKCQALAKPSRELTDEEIRAAYSAASRGSYDAVYVMAGYRAIIAADRKTRGEAK